MFVWILCCQGLFILIQESFGQKVIDSIQGQLRQELAVSNFNFLARSITDFTVAGAIECGVLNKKAPYETKIVDLRYMAKDCLISEWSLNGVKLEVLLKSLNGDEYEFNFISKNPEIFYFALWGFRLLGLVAILGIALAVKATTNSELEIARRMKNLALEVSHDIRSPLSSLTMSLKEHVFNEPEEKKVVLASLERINDIANNLLAIDKKVHPQEKFEATLLIPLINSVISEKRIQFNAVKELKFVSTFNCSPFISAMLDGSLFQRALSNLLNNAIEAMRENPEIRITIDEENEVISLVIEDFGSGMSRDVLDKIGERGFTTKKNSNSAGHGIGLSSSMEAIKKLGGSIGVDSQEMVGTKITIKLPKSSAPHWLADEINLNLYEEIWILDDDPSIHFQWRQKIYARIMSFYNIEDFKKQLMMSESKKRLYLVDYELNSNMTGLEMILDLNLNRSSLLVSSVFDRSEVIKAISHYGMSMIPKYLIDEVKIIERGPSAYEYVYIDDDAILRMGWEIKAKKSDVNLLTLANIDDFFKNEKEINKDKTKIYIDSNLGSHSLKGEDFAASLHKDGYKQLFLATGYPKEEFAHLPWLAIEGKVCPF